MEFRLLVESPEPSGPDSFTLEGKHWSVTDSYDISNPDTIPEYTCISYMWGRERIPHPYKDATTISGHTLPALAAAISNNLGSSFWLDAFCVPTEQPMKQATLESMGFIYSRAKQVVVAFWADSFDAVKQITQSDQLNDDNLHLLEHNEWVTRGWTYQEVVNSQAVYCVCEGLAGSSIAGGEFFNRVGYSLSLYQKRNNINGFDMVERFPRLSALTDLFADWYIANYTERAALQVMANMDRREHRKPTHYFHAMIGAVTQRPPSQSTKGTVAELAELFMAICEEKNDYSFIYSATARDPTPGKHWRPIAGRLPAILPWHCSGQAQRARRDGSAFWLEDMLALGPSRVLSDVAKNIITRWIHQPELVVESDALIAQRLFIVLKRMGFTGSSDYVVVEGGLFFPLYAVQAPAMVLVTASITWVFGAPGLLVVKEDETEYIPGIFAGSMDAKAAAPVLLA